MFGFKYRFLKLVVILAVGAFWQNGVQAMDLSKPLPKLMAQELLAGNSSHFHEDFDKGLTGECVSLVNRLEKAVQREVDSFPKTGEYLLLLGGLQFKLHRTDIAQV